MKKTIEKEVEVCDACGAEMSHPTKCMTCAKEVCHECGDKLMVTYPHAVNFSGTGDGVYCLDCDKKHYISSDDARHNAYVKIKELREERERFYGSFRARSAEAEERLIRAAK